MNRIFWAIVAILVLALPLPVAAQISRSTINNPQIVLVASAPSGSCSANFPDQQTITAGIIYTCQAGTWTAIGGGSGPGISLTTTGTSGAATLTGTVLNIPQYAGAVSSLTTTGTSGAATLTGGVLNIPQYAGFANPMTTLGDIIYENATPAPANLAGPTTGTVAYNLCSTPISSTAQTPAWCLPGISGRSVVSGTDTVVATDRGTVITYNYASAVAVTLTSAATLGNFFDFAVTNQNAGAVTFTPGAGTINGAGTLVLSEGQNCVFSSPDNINYTALCANGQIVGGQGITITPTATGQSIAAVNTASVVPGDLLCAQAADTTIDPVTITAGSSSTGTVCTLNGTYSTSHNHYRIIGQLIGVTGNSTTNMNGGPYTVTSAGAGNIVFACTVANGAINTSGTWYRWCENQSTDSITSYKTFANNQSVIGANTMVKGVPVDHRMQFGLFQSSAAPTYLMSVNLSTASGSTPLTVNVALPAKNSALSYGNEVSFDLVPLNIGSSGLIAATFQAAQADQTAGDWVSLTAFPVSVDTTSTDTLSIGAYFTATGLATATYVSGGSPSGTGNVTLGSFNNSCTATASMAIASGTPGTITITSRGQSCTAAATTATCTSGTATCSGTVTLTSTLGGAPGNALDLVSLQ